MWACAHRHTVTCALRALGVNTLLEKQDIGKQGAQFRMGIWWALQRDYHGIITVDGNDKDSIEDVSLFIEKFSGLTYLLGATMSSMVCILG